MRPPRLQIVILLYLCNIRSLNAIKFERCIKTMTNGCSLPYGIPWPYKKDYRPACLRHDVCYSCGSQFDWSREECDERFRRDMVFICYEAEERYTSSYGINWSDLWSKLKGISLVAKGIMHWFFVDSDSLKHCLIGAQMYYDGVCGFSRKYFLNRPMDECDLPCAQIVGNPHLSMDEMYPELYHLSRRKRTRRIR